MSRLYKRENRYDNHVTSKYGLLREEYDSIVSQPCGICGTTNVKRVLDHDHTIRTKRLSVRGALCNNCNIREGWFTKYKAQVLAWQGKAKQDLMSALASLD